MKRLLSYDESIRKHHIFNPEVYIEDPDKRAGVALYLEGLGYDISGAAVGIGKDKWLSYDIIEMNDILGIDKYGIIHVGCWSDKYEENHKEKVIKHLEERQKERYITFEDGTVIDLNITSCGDNSELFKVLALYRDDTDYGKLVYYKNPPPVWFWNNHKEEDRLWINCQWDNFEKDCDVEWVREKCIMLYTLEDILKYKDLIK